MSHSRSLVPVTLAVPGVNLGAYITNVNQVSILSSDEERELAERYFYEEDLDAARQLILAHYGSLCSVFLPTIEAQQEHES